MTVRVRLMGEFRKYLRGRPEPLMLEVPAASTVADLAAVLDLDTRLETVVGINGTLAALDSPLADGDEVIFVSPMSGGSDGGQPAASTSRGDATPHRLPGSITIRRRPQC